MNKKLPLVSIITPSYNQANFIEDTILSVKNQEYPNIEHIIIDGGSTDNTLEILKKYERSYNMKWTSKQDKGQSAAINKGFRMAKGEIIGWLNSDDTYFSIYTISDVVKFFEKHVNIKVIYGDTISIDHRNKIITASAALPIFSYFLLKKINFISQPSTFFIRNIIDNYYLDESLHYSMDYDFWLKIGKENKFYYVNKILSCFRRHRNSKSLSQTSKMRDEHLSVKQRYNLNSLNNLDKLVTFLMAVLAKLFDRIIGLPKSLYLSDRSDFAFDIKIPSKLELFKNHLSIKEILEKFKIH